jgi:hypothetical protein
VTGAKWSGQHRRLSEKLRARAIGQLCHFCGLPMLPGQPLDLDHAPDGRSYRGVAHRHCNRADGGRKSLAIQRGRGRLRRRRFVMPSEAAYGIEISTDRTHTSVVEAGRGADGRIVVKLAGYLSGTDHAGVIRDMVTGRPKREVLAVLLDPRSPAATLVEPLEALRVDITLADTHTMAASHGDFSDLLKAGKLTIEPHPALTAAARHAMTRPLSGAEALERRKPAVDTSPIVASELAVWAVLHVERRATRIHVYDPDWKGSKEAAG